MRRFLSGREQCDEQVRILIDPTEPSAPSFEAISRSLPRFSDSGKLFCS